MELKKHFEAGWWEQLEPYMKSKEFGQLAKDLVDITSNKLIAPRFYNTFAAFKHCPFDKLNTIILAEDPFDGINKDGSLVADGLAFSSRYSSQAPLETDMILESINKQIFDGKNYQISVCLLILISINKQIFDGKNYHIGINWELSNWADQGILLLNSALTTEVAGMRNQSHAMLWRPFIKEVVRIIDTKCNHVAVVLMGNVASSYRPFFTNKSFFMMKCQHPKNAVKMGYSWDDELIFKRISAYHQFMNQIEIKWDV